MSTDLKYIRSSVVFIASNNLCSFESCSPNKIHSKLNKKKEKKSLCLKYFLAIRANTVNEKRKEIFAPEKYFLAIRANTVKPDAFFVKWSHLFDLCIDVEFASGFSNSDIKLSHTH